MTTDVLMLAVYVSAALFFSFLCSVAEAVLLCITPSYIGGLKAKKPKRAALLHKIKIEKVGQSLAAILTLNTIAHTVGAIGAGAKATVVFGSAWFGVFSAAMTLMILFFSEIVPKTIGALYWSKLVSPTVFFVRSLVFLLYPIVWVSEKMTHYISHGASTNVLSRDELIAMASIGLEIGQIRRSESTIINNLLKFESLKVADIMTPRTVISALPEKMKIKDFWPKVSEIPFSRIPLYRTNIDEITGFVLKQDILIRFAQNRGEDFLEQFKIEIHMVPESISLVGLFETFLKDRKHIAIVVNEHGGTEGLVTLEDLLETIMGMEIVDETDNVADMRLLARKKWEARVKAMGVKADSLLEP
jgi:CBS domain containing-hemolysin-like protein